MMLRGEWESHPLLSRPFSFLTSGEKIQVLLKIKGLGTHLLSMLHPEQKVNIFGPLGNKFPNPGSKLRPVLIAGGIGIAGLYAWAKKLKPREPLLIYGAKTKEELVLKKELDIETLFCTEDGSYGEKGMVTEPLSKMLPHSSKIIVYGCGPDKMLKTLISICNRYKVPNFVSLESILGCGHGVCMGCTIQTTLGIRYVCIDGPVFPGRIIL
jgi:dihydroorotate dehydrogenase electron transfer subunit